MATDGPTPTPCDSEILKRGVVVFVGDTIGSCALERWVQKIARASGQRVDWHWAGGRARVLAIGNIAKVQAALVLAKPEYDKLHAAACGKLGL